MNKKKLTDYDFPKDLKDMTENEMELLSYEIRDFLIASVAKTGGHLASNLGVVEMTIAIHRVFDLPEDKIVWDVGHQAYVHKILTGRAGEFHTLRARGGLSGFPKRNESPCDTYSSGHSSSSISAAMGIAEARDIQGESYSVVAVTGDGAMTGGPAFEGLNNAGTKKTKMIVILNDNEMSISENIGSISKHLRKLRSSKKYIDMKKSLKKTLTSMPGVGEPIYRGLDHMKDLMRYAVIVDSIFEDLGFKYYGPVDGNNIREMIKILETAKDIEGPVLIHAVTKKGKGYRNAEADPGKFHGIGPFEPETGREIGKSGGRSLSIVCGDKLRSLAGRNEKIVAITAAMTDGTGLAGFAKAFPERFFDVGIAEAHAATFAAGLAIGGMRPFVCIYSTFLQRAYDQIAMEVAMQGLPVVFMIDRAGNVGADGETHHGVFDLSYLSHIPGMTILAPSGAGELEAMMEFACNADSPVAIRFSKEAGEAGVAGGLPAVTKGKSRRLKSGDGVEIWAAGNMAGVALEAAETLAREGISAGVVDARFIKPLDEGALRLVGEKGLPVITLEDNVLSGGFGQHVSAFIEAGGFTNPVLNIGWPDEFIPQGPVDSLKRDYGLDAEGVAAKISELWRKNA